MEHFFNLPVTYDGVDYEFTGRLVTFGFTYKFHIMIEKKEIIFERDDDMNFRAINLHPENDARISKPLLEAVIAQLEKLAE